MAIDFDLTHFIKETQLQHGLRSGDYDRYHAYISNRLATLRKQVGLANERKKFLHKEVTPANASDARHLMLLALYAERCWADAESILVKHQAQKSSARGESNKPKGGVPPRDLCGKRLNKSVKWAEKLRTVANAVGSPRLQAECEAYFLETSGRCAGAHARYAEAKEFFMKARDTYYGLQGGSTDAQWAVVQLKVNELDDRVVFCMQQLDEDPASYTPASVNRGRSGDDDGGEHAGTSLKWNGRTLSVPSIWVKDALREARNVPVEALQAKVLEGPEVVPVGQTNKVLDLMDRRINHYNDALAYAREDLRDTAEGSAAKVERQLTVHYFLFQVSQETLRRTLFLAEVYSRRFHATEKVVRQRGQQHRRHAATTGRSAKKSGVTPAQFASPLEVVRLYEAASDAVEQMQLLPGVDERDDVAEMAAAAKAGKLVYTGESWRVMGDTARAEQCYRAAMAVLKDAKSAPEARKLFDLAESASLQVAAESVLSSFTKASLHSTPLVYLTDAAPDQVDVAQNIVRFPPDYQATMCKPTFVDIASTYVEFPLEDIGSTDGNAEGEGQASRAANSQQQHHHPQQQPSKKKDATGGAKGKEDGGGDEKKKWGWKWGWGN